MNLATDPGRRPTSSAFRERRSAFRVVDPNTRRPVGQGAETFSPCIADRKLQRLVFPIECLSSRTFPPSLG